MNSLCHDWEIPTRHRVRYAVSKIIIYFLYVSGGIFPENSDHLVNAFQNAARLVNTFSENLKLQTTVTNVDTNDSFKVQKAGK